MISKETVELVKKFRDDRDWKKFHNPKDLAISLSLEAAELLEIFQWSADDLECSDRLDKIREELADVLCYSVLLADRCGLDMDEIIREKVEKNAQKYPTDIAYGNKAKYTELKKKHNSELRNKPPLCKGRRRVTTEGLCCFASFSDTLAFASLPRRSKK